MTYGYQSILERENGLATFDDLGEAFLESLATPNNSPSTNPIILMGHGIGGLIMKQVYCALLKLDLMLLNNLQALISLSKLQGEAENSLFSAIRGVVFFDVPHDGMDISLVADGPNQPLIESLRQANSGLLEKMHNGFVKALADRLDIEIFSFYGTLQSSMKQQVRYTLFHHRE